MSDAAIRVQGLGKRYRIGAPQPLGRGRGRALWQRIRSPFRYLAQSLRAPAPEEIIWALKDVSFDVERGGAVGVIGRNGAGKTTLLKILSRITEPTEGRAEIRGRASSLLEVGTGFHRELTGRENIFLSAAILGMRRAEIRRKFDEIVAFSEIGKFIDTPVKYYSSGMYVRLAFSVAAHLEPEILLVDEVLAVGDVGFQRKCLGKMGDVSHAGRTVLFVSHNMAAVENLCPEAVLLDGGRLVRRGRSREVINHYLETVLPAAFEGVALSEQKDRSGNGRIRLTSFHIEDGAGRKLAAAQSGMDLVLVFGFRCRDGDSPRRVDVGFSVNAGNDQMLFVFYRSYAGEVFPRVPRSGSFRCRVPRLPLSPGRYRVGARVSVAGDEADWPRNGVGYLDVEAGDFYGTGSIGFGAVTPFLVDGRWEVDEA